VKSIPILILLSSVAIAAEPVPTQPQTRGLLGRSTPVAIRSLAETARDKPSRPGIVSQAESTAPTPGPFTPDPTRTPKPEVAAAVPEPTAAPQPIGYVVAPTPIVIVIDWRGPRRERQAAAPPAPAPTAAPNVSGAAGRKR